MEGKVLFVKSCEVEVRPYSHEVRVRNFDGFKYSDPGPGVVPKPDFEYEFCNVLNYRYCDGKELNIAMTKKVQEVIGLPLDCFFKDQERIKDLEDKNSTLVKEVSNFKSMGFLSRLKFLFTGKV